MSFDVISSLLVWNVTSCFRSFSFQHGDQGLDISRIRIIEEASFELIWRWMMYLMIRVFGCDLELKGYFGNLSVELLWNRDIGWYEFIIV